MILVVGSRGMLGHDLMQVLTGDVRGVDIEEIDITSFESTRRVLLTLKPEVVVNAAAYTDVDGCETKRELAMQVNGEGVAHLALAAREIGAKLVHVSTDYVFDGSKKGPYDEWDCTNPINIYGVSKLMGERFVSTLTNRFQIVRTSWLYGSNGRNFVETIIKLLSERESIEVVDDQTGCPTYTYDVARKLREVVGKGYGIYHITNTGNCSWYDFALAIALKMGLKKQITPVSSERFRRPAKRPANSVLGNTILRLESIGEPRHWKDALGEYLKTR